MQIPLLIPVSKAGFSMTIDGKMVETATNGHDLIIYAFVTDTIGSKGTVGYVAAVHPRFNDDAEQAPGNKTIHAHYVELDGGLCVKDINSNSSVTITKNNDGTQTISISGTSGETVVKWIVAGYDASASGICPEHVYDIEES